MSVWFVRGLSGEQAWFTVGTRDQAPSPLWSSLNLSPHTHYSLSAVSSMSRSTVGVRTWYMYHKQKNQT